MQGTGAGALEVSDLNHQPRQVNATFNAVRLKLDDILELQRRVLEAVLSRQQLAVTQMHLRRVRFNPRRFNEAFFFYGMEDIELGYRLQKKLGCRMVSGPAAKAFHQYFPTYEYFIERCRQAGYSLGKLTDLHPELKDRFIENGRRTRLLKRFHLLYRMFSSASGPLYRLVKRWQEQRGTGSVAGILDQYYFWAVRYHFFLGYSQYVRYAAPGQAAHSVLRLGRESIPTFAIERHD